MADMNKVMLIGNLTRDPELRFLASGQAMAKLGLAVNRRWKDKDGREQKEVTFFNLVAFEKQAETLAKFCKRGHRLFIDGRLTARTVTNDKGETRTFHDIRIDDFQFLTPSAKAGSGESTETDTEVE